MSNQMTVQRTGTGIAALGSGPTVLGQAQARIPIGGHIRAGIMVLTATAAKNQKAVTMYEKGRLEGVPFQTLARQIKEACNFQRSPMRPTNVPYFTVRAGDFKNPMAAKILMDQYGETRDQQHGKQLYRIPVIFPLDNWQAVMPHEFACFTAGEKRFWSEYDEDGNRRCMTHAEIPMVQQGNKRVASRPAGGRKSIPRPDTNGVCDPDSCEQYQRRECTLTGQLIFHIPGIPGADAVQLSTRSFYALSGIRQSLELVAFLHGRISGTVGGKPIFYLTKKLETISRIDPNSGKSVRTEHWIIALDADVDMTRMYQASEGPAMLEAGGQAAEALDHDQHLTEFDETSGEIYESTPASTGEDTAPMEGELLPGDQVPVQEPEAASGEAPADDEKEASTEADLLLTIKEATEVNQLNEVAAALGSIEDKARVARIREAMGKKHSELTGGDA